MSARFRYLFRNAMSLIIAIFAGSLIGKPSQIMGIHNMTVGGSSRWKEIADPIVAPDSPGYIYLLCEDQGAFITFNFTGARFLGVHSTLNNNHGLSIVVSLLLFQELSNVNDQCREIKQRINDKDLKFNRSKEYMVPQTLSFWQDDFDEKENYVISILNLEPKRITLTNVELIGVNPQPGVVKSDSGYDLSIPSLPFGT